MNFDALMIVLIVIAILSSLFFIMALLADIVWPWLEDRKPRRQATYRPRSGKA